MDLNEFLIKIQDSDTIPDSSIIINDVYNTLKLAGYSYLHLNCHDESVFEKVNNGIVENLLVAIYEDNSGYITTCLFSKYGLSIKHSVSYNKNLTIHEKEIIPNGWYNRWKYCYCYSYKDDSTLDYIQLNIWKNQKDFNQLPEIDVSQIIYVNNVIKSVEFQYIGIKFEYENYRDIIIREPLNLTLNKNNFDLYKDKVDYFSVSGHIVEELFDFKFSNYTPQSLISLFPKILTDAQKFVILMSKN